MGQRCTLAADIYSLGVLLVELTTLSVVYKRGEWRLPRAPIDCPQVGSPWEGCCTVFSSTVFSSALLARSQTSCKHTRTPHHVSSRRLWWIW